MPDFEKVYPGEPLEPKSADWNGFGEASKIVLKGRIGREGTGALTRDPLIPSLRVLVKLTSGPWNATNIVSFDRGSTPIDPAVNPFEAQRTPVLAKSGGALSAGDTWGVLAEPVPSTGGTVPAVVQGVCVANVNVLDAAHNFAERQASGSTLLSGSYGRARILYKPSGTGVKTCLVELIGEDGKGAFGNYYTFSPAQTTITGYTADGNYHLLLETVTKIPANKDLWLSAGLTVGAQPYVDSSTGAYSMAGYLAAQLVDVDPGTLVFAGTALTPTQERKFAQCSLSNGSVYIPAIASTPGAFQDQVVWGCRIPAQTDDHWIGIALQEVCVVSGLATGPHIQVNGSGPPDIGAGAVWLALTPCAADTASTLPALNTAVPTVSGTAQVGHVLTGSAGTWTGSPTFAYLWQHGDGSAAAATATGSTYTPAAGDVGFTMVLLVTATTSGGSFTATSAPTAAVIV